MEINRSLLTDFTAINISRELAAMTRAAQTLADLADLDETTELVDLLQTASEQTEPQNTVTLLCVAMLKIKAIGQKAKFPELVNYADKAIADLAHVDKVQTTLLNPRIPSMAEVADGDYIIACKRYIEHGDEGYVLSGPGYIDTEFTAAEALFPTVNDSFHTCLDNTNGDAAVVTITASTDPNHPDCHTITIDGTPVVAPNGNTYWKLSLNLKVYTLTVVDEDEEYIFGFDHADNKFKIVGWNKEYSSPAVEIDKLDLFSADATVAEAEIGESPVSLIDDTIDNIVSGLNDIILTGLNPFFEYNGMLVRMTINNRNANPVYHVFNQHFTALPKHLLRDRKKRAKYQQFFNVSENVRLMPMKHNLKAMTHMDFIIDLNSLNKVSPLFRGVAADVKIYLLYGDPVEENIIK